MRVVRLASAERTFLRSAAFLPPDLREIVTEQLSKQVGEDDERLALQDADAERFREIFTEQLARAGFDAEYRLTVEGEMLENLIDAFAS
jgi:hypothetical protein